MTAKLTRQNEKWMRLAIYHARQGLGRTAPNPPVGCVLVKDGEILSVARTRDGGRPHAEARALEKAGEIYGKEVKGASAYVTLEPCCHEGRTPPCAKALVDAGIRKVYIGCKDHAPHVNGKGIAFLREYGIKVYTGLLEAECYDLAKGFFLSQLYNRPLVTIKAATSLDGKIATHSGESQWITSELSRKRAHLERSYHDAVLCGIGTVLKDNPDLTCRLTGYEHRNIRVVLDSNLRIPQQSRLVKSASKTRPLWVFCQKRPDDNKAKKDQASYEKKIKALKAAGVTLFEMEDMQDLPALLARLASKGITRLMVEGGAKINAAFCEADLADRVVWFRAPVIIGRQGKEAFNGRILEKLKDAQCYHCTDSFPVEPDRLEIYHKAE